MFFGATFLSGSQVSIGWWHYLIDTDNDDDIAYKNISGCDPFNQNFWKFRSKTQWIGLVQLEKLKKTGPPFEVDHFSQSDRLEFWLNGSRPVFPQMGT